MGLGKSHLGTSLAARRRSAQGGSLLQGMTGFPLLSYPRTKEGPRVLPLRSPLYVTSEGGGVYPPDSSAGAIWPSASSEYRTAFRSCWVTASSVPIRTRTRAKAVSWTSSAALLAASASF